MCRLAWLASVGAGLYLGTFCLPVAAQADPFDEHLLPAVRRLTSAVPGELPNTVRFVTFASVRALASDAVEGAPADSATIAFPVFQIRYKHGWIIVDAGMDREIAGEELAFSQERYDTSQQALRKARLIVVTHEHHDHVAGVIRSPHLAEVAPKTLLNRAQIQTLMERPNVPALRLDSTAAASYLAVDYGLLLPVAPGVVLIRAPGHTPGSQMVYVRLASGREILLTGDIAWLMRGIQDRRQKPDSTSQQLGEDRVTIQQQLAWLSTVNAQTGIAVLPCHDADWLETWRRRGYLREGLDLSAP